MKKIEISSKNKNWGNFLWKPKNQQYFHCFSISLILDRVQGILSENGSQGFSESYGTGKREMRILFY